MAKLEVISTSFYSQIQQNLHTYLEKKEPRNVHLTYREKEVWELVAQGHSAKRIGLILNISHRTVERYTEDLKFKLICSSKSMLIVLYHDLKNG